MSRLRGARRAATGGALVVMVTLPLMAFFVAPDARADSTPGANLAGINATATATAVQIAPLTPGLVGAGNVSQGNLVEADIPYATSSTQTGPTSTSVGSPVYPGDTAAGAGSALATFAPQLPSPLVQAMNDPVLARAAYPAEVSEGSSATYNPPGPPGTGVGTASAQANDAGSSSQSAVNKESLGSVITVASSTASSSTVLNASSVVGKSHTDVGTIKLLGGLISIAGITSDATATSDGNTGQPTSDFKLGAVTVAGTPASIGPKGITLGSTGLGNSLAPSANQVLVALKQAGISVYTIAPSTTFNGGSASVTSGALVVQFVDANVPNPNGQVPVNSVGLDLNLGLSEASADATGLPPIPSFGAIPGGPAMAPTASGAGATGGSVTPAQAGGAVPVSPGGVTSVSSSGSAPSVATSPGSPGSAGAATPSQSAPASATAPSPPATLLGAPIKVAWVVIAFLLSLVAAGPLLGFANWQLLRGRKS